MSESRVTGLVFFVPFVYKTKRSEVSPSVVTFFITLVGIQSVHRHRRGPSMEESGYVIKGSLRSCFLTFETHRIFCLQKTECQGLRSSGSDHNCYNQGRLPTLPPRGSGTRSKSRPTGRNRKEQNLFVVGLRTEVVVYHKRGPNTDEGVKGRSRPEVRIT